MVVVGIACNFPNKPDYSFILLCNSSFGASSQIAAIVPPYLPGVGERVGLQHQKIPQVPPQSELTKCHQKPSQIGADSPRGMLGGQL